MNETTSVFDRFLVPSYLNQRTAHKKQSDFTCFFLITDIDFRHEKLRSILISFPRLR